MPSNATPQKFQHAVRAGFKRLENFRKARLMFLRAFCGQYYDKDRGPIGTEPLNLTFNAIAILVPNIVMTFPKHVVTSRFTAYRPYAKLLKLALDKTAKDVDLKDKLRRWIVDALFTMGILKTGLCQSDTVYAMTPDDNIDAGTLYTELVDFDNFTFDPDCTALETATFLGDRVRVPRAMLLDSGLYRNDLIERLPDSGTDVEDGVKMFSRRQSPEFSETDLHDSVDVVENYVPSMNAIITTPGCGMVFPEFLRIEDYYGPKRPTGPYTFLCLTPPVPGNPLPVAPVGIWHDLHTRANIMVTKVFDQAERQKDVVAYKPAAVEDAEQIRTAKDGETVAVNDPDSVKVLNFGGQRSSNETHIQQLMFWWNMMSGNVESLGGIRESSATATQAQILNANQSVRIEDLRDIVYSATANEAELRAWYLHTDPLIELPLTDRQSVPAQYVTGPSGPMVAQPPRLEEVQVLLTPEVRRGDWLDFTFDIKPKSMSRMDPQLRLQRMLEFATKVIPAAAAAAQTCMALGVPFSFPKFVQLMGEEMEIEWMDEVFFDPDFQMAMAETMMRSPSMATSKGQLMPQIAQNQQPASIPSIPSDQTLANREEQRTAADAQRARS